MSTLTLTILSLFLCRYVASVNLALHVLHMFLDSVISSILCFKLSLSNHKMTMELSISDIECLFRILHNSSALYYVFQVVV